MRSLVRVVTSSESAARDAAAIGAGIPSRALMQRAGAAAAAEIALRYRDHLVYGALVLAGPGNNGGDAWVVARALAASGVAVRVVEPIAAKTDDARAERALATAMLDQAAVSPTVGDGEERLIVDGLLGTGASGPLRGAIAAVVAAVNERRAHGATVVALDLPSGVDATTGQAAAGAVTADCTLTFGTVKRGQLVNRDACGAVLVLDIGLGPHAQLADGAPLLIDEPWVAAHVPRISAATHKGVRKKIVIVGGAPGMAGAAILAARAALRSGVGMVKLVVASESLSAVQQGEPHALASIWPSDDDAADDAITRWADAVVAGPGLGRSDESRALLDRVLSRWRGPTLLDADALTLFEGRAGELAARLGGRASVITPHPAEFARLVGLSVDAVLEQRFDLPRDLARTLGATVLLKGVPTVVASPAGERFVSATGTPALATAGSGDILSGIAGTMLAQMDDPFAAAALAAWVHGRAAERVPTGGGVRGISLDDVVAELRDGWTFDDRPTRYPILAELPEIRLDGAARS